MQHNTSVELELSPELRQKLILAIFNHPGSGALLTQYQASIVGDFSAPRLAFADPKLATAFLLKYG